jgi:cyanophycin synthetase
LEHLIACVVVSLELHFEPYGGSVKKTSTTTRAVSKGASHRPMRVREIGVYRGPHLYSHTPMIRLQLDLGALEEWPTDRIDGFGPRLVELLPGLSRHGCSYGEAGGLLRRIEEGTWIGHVVEHVALELQTCVGAAVSRGKTRSVKGSPGVYNVMYAYEAEEVGIVAGGLALALVRSLLPEPLQRVQGLERLLEPKLAARMSEAFDLGEALNALEAEARRHRLGPTTASLVAEARRRGIPVLRLDEHSLVQLGHGSRQQRIRASITGRTSHIAVEAAGDKNLTRNLLAQANVPTPQGRVVRTAEEAVKAAEALGYPVVTKPLDGNHGRGVNLDLSSPEQVVWGFEQARLHGRRVIVEQLLTGKDHRILVVNGEVVAVAERTPAQVVGDGASTVRQLIDIANADPRRGEGHEKVMTRIKVDDHVVEMLARAGLTLDSTPEAGRAVQLRATANLSTGGTAIDRTDIIHRDNLAMCRRAALAVGLDIAGIDLIAPDISRSIRETGGGVVEVNAAPGFRMHLEPSEGRPRDVAKPVIDMLFPRGRRGRIPLYAVTGTNGKSTTVRMLARILCESGLNVGLTTTSGVYIGQERVMKADASGPKSARLLLRDPTVDAVVLETARGGILREGLAFDACDVGAVLNISSDHLGLKGVDTLDDLAAVKSVVVESVKRRGCSVLNADDPHTLRMARHARGRIGWFTLRGGSEAPGFLQAHAASGGLLVAPQPGEGGTWIVIQDGGQTIPLMPVAELPSALGGSAGFNVQNAMAAALMAYGDGVDLQFIRRGLAAFTNSFEDSPGRLNIHDGHGFRVIFDYAHNPAGLRALGEVVQVQRARHARAIGMISIPGDRRDDDIREMGQIAASLFDEVVFREDDTGRGRPHGQVMALLREGAIAAGVAPDRIHCIVREKDAAQFCLSWARPGDLVVMTPTDVDGVWRQIQTFKPEPGRGDAADAHAWRKSA